MPQMISYEPAQASMGLLYASLEDTHGAIWEKLSSVKNKPFSASCEKIDWRLFYKADGQLYDMMNAEIALIPIRDEITAYVCNLADGWDSLYSNIAKEKNLKAYFFRSTFSESVRFKVFEMKLWNSNLLERQIRVLQDEAGWSFFSRGNVLCFEDTKSYAKKIIRERLSRGLIEEYSEYNGYNISSVTSTDVECCIFRR